MVSNYDRFSNCTAPTLNKSNYTSHSSQLNLYVDNTPVTPWYYNRKRGRPYNRHYYHGGQRGYYNNNNNHNNHRSRYPFTCSPSVYPLSRSQSTYNIDYNTYTTTNTTNNNSNGRNHRYSNCGYLLNNEQPTDEYIDDCLLTDIEQYQLNHFYNEFKQLQCKSKSSLNLSTSSIIVYNINNKDEDDNHEDYTDVHDDIQDTVEHQMNSMESNNNNQEVGKSGNMNDYLTLVWDDLPETLG
ncbi:hypothetical protein Smp_176650 [Schistosoma mansoni]|uniref:hypothetical protein n=1 Tax=Schistosoma mansoni TaxID=6183 RepID=UPI0001A62D8D|nr:hypothetical protein Smp_176650 [Schistosoma mansoni]|eukprot:XP_018645088.1 hypothetical protein Smp_176650 [Schistosoma mansoni]